MADAISLGSFPSVLFLPSCFFQRVDGLMHPLTQLRLEPESRAGRARRATLHIPFLVHLHAAEYSNLYASALPRAVLSGAVRPIPDETV